MNYKSFLTDTWNKFSQLFSKFVKKTFVGTRAEWDLLSAAEKKQYDLADFTDDIASGVPIISDTVTAGDMNAVTSNAVAQAIALPKYLKVVTTSDQDALEANFKTLFPEGVYLAFWQKGGSHEVLIIQNTDPDYYSYLWFGYGQILVQRRHTPSLGWETVGILSNN